MAPWSWSGARARSSAVTACAEAVRRLTSPVDAVGASDRARHPQPRVARVAARPRPLRRVDLFKLRRRRQLQPGRLEHREAARGRTLRQGVRAALLPSRTKD